MLRAKNCLVGKIIQKIGLSGAVACGKEKVYPQLQEKETTPTNQTQNIVADDGVYGLSKVVVNPIPNEYIIPSGNETITENGTYDITEKASASVNVQPNLQSKSLTITENTTTNISADSGYDGLSDVSITTNVSSGGGAWELPDGIKFSGATSYPDMDGKNLTSLNRMFYTGNTSLVVAPRIFNTGNCTGASEMFSNCTNLETIPQAYDLSGCTTIASMFNGCDKLKDVPLMQVSNLNVSSGNMRYVFTGCNSLSNESLNNILGLCASIKGYSAYSNVTFTRLGLSTEQIAKLSSMSNYASATAKGWH